MNKPGVLKPLFFVYISYFVQVCDLSWRFSHMSATYGYSEHRGGGSRNFGGGVGGERAGNLGGKGARKMNLCFLYSVFLLKYFQNCQRWEGGGLP